MLTARVQRTCQSCKNLKYTCINRGKKICLKCYVRKSGCDGVKPPKSKLLKSNPKVTTSVTCKSIVRSFNMKTMAKNVHGGWCCRSWRLLTWRPRNRRHASSSPDDCSSC